MNDLLGLDKIRREAGISTTLGGLAAFSVASLLAFTLHFSPSAGLSGANLIGILILAPAVSVPYLLLYAIPRPDGDTWSEGATIVAMVIEGFMAVIYFWGFRWNDGEFDLVYVVVPAAQMLVSILAVAFSFGVRFLRRTKRSNPSKSSLRSLTP